MTDGPADQPAQPETPATGPGGQPPEEPPGRSPQPPPAPAPAAYPPHGVAAPPGYPFAPRVREPWINPAKRRSAGWLAAAAAALLLGAGVLIGIAAAPGHGRGDERFGPVGRGMIERHMIERRIERQLQRHIRRGMHAHGPGAPWRRGGARVFPTPSSTATTSPQPATSTAVPSPGSTSSHR